MIIRQALLAILLSAFMISCENEPGDVGLNFISPGDTTGVRYLDSEKDSLTITSTSFERPVNTYGSLNLLLGKYEEFESKTIIRFLSITGDYDSAVVNSATLYLRTAEYYFKNNTGVTAFDLFRINTNLNLQTITADSINSSAVGTTPLGSYSGVAPDSQFISITVDNQTVRDWLEYAADTSYAQKNYGLMLQPNSASTTIRGFYSFVNEPDLVPYMTVILTKNGETDTLRLDISESLTLSGSSPANFPPDRMVVQNGIAFRSALNFDLSKLPQNVIINNATVQFTLDHNASYISKDGNRTMIVGLINDTTGFGDTLFVNAFPRDSVNYSVSINPIFQNWNSGNLPNLGMSIRGFFELQNIDRFIFYSPAVSDTTLRPRLKIYYTLRN